MKSNIFLEESANGILETIITIIIAIILIGFLIWVFWLNLIPAMQETLSKP
jgi:hypothetical protein